MNFFCVRCLITFSNNKIQIHDMSLIVMELLFHVKELLSIISFTTSILFLIIFLFI